MKPIYVVLFADFTGDTYTRTESFVADDFDHAVEQAEKLSETEEIVAVWRAGYGVAILREGF